MKELGPQDWVAVVGVVVTAIMTFVTYWMARATKNMADATRQSVQAASEPQLAIEELSLSRDSISGPPSATGSATVIEYKLQFGVLLKNPGQVLVQYRVDEMSASITNFPWREQGTYRNMEGVIHPGLTRLFRGLHTVVSATNTPNLMNARVRVRIRFWSLRDQVREVRATIDADVRTPPTPQTPWVYVEGPHYDVVQK